MLCFFPLYTSVGIGIGKNRNIFLTIPIPNLGYISHSYQDPHDLFVIFIVCLFVLQLVSVNCPANNRPIATVRQGSLEDYEATVTACKDAWQTWADVSAETTTSTVNPQKFRPPKEFGPLISFAK